MKIKALDHVEDVNQIPEPDGNGGFILRTVITEMKAGEVYDLDDAQGKRLVARGLASEDMNAAVLPHLSPTPAPAEPAAQEASPAPAPAADPKTEK